MPNLLLIEDVGEFVLSPRIESTGYYKGHPQDVFVEETTGLGDHPAFVVTGSELLFYEIDIGNDVILVNQARILMVVIGKDVAHLGGIVAHRPWRIVFSRKEVRQFDNEPFGFGV